MKWKKIITEISGSRCLKKEYKKQGKNNPFPHSSLPGTVPSFRIPMLDVAIGELFSAATSSHIFYKGWI